MKNTRQLDSAKLPYCQNENRFLLFTDPISSAGLLHKLDDFLSVCEIAIRTNRTLVDYSAKLSNSHSARTKVSQKLTSNASGSNWVVGLAACLKTLSPFLRSQKIKQKTHLFRLNNKIFQVSEPPTVFSVRQRDVYYQKKLLNPKKFLCIWIALQIFIHEVDFYRTLPTPMSNYAYFS